MQLLSKTNGWFGKMVLSYDLCLGFATADVTLSGQRGRMRAADHQFQQPLVVGVMARQAREGEQDGVKFDVEGSGYGFRVIRQLKAEQAELPTTCQMTRP
ncbi:hypothetical protein P3G55_26810 [Leptospira sp. 96542]|nr:hypothetical protein [Leptospira sp. 96542]